MSIVPKYLIEKYRSLRKQSYLRKIGSYRYQYAFIGAGSHAIANLYPCLHYLQIPLKYICTKNKKNAEAIAAGFPGCSGISVMDTLLNDPEVHGVFIAAPATLHFEMTKKCLAAGKQVFVEKPVCFSAAQLDELRLAAGTKICFAGLQRRFAPINRLLAGRISKNTHYHYRYLTGAYPEGDPVYELFIHPIDNVVRLFGNAEILHISKIEAHAGNTYFLHLLHNRSSNGLIELSSNYNWSDASEYMEINTEKEILQYHYPNRLLGSKKNQLLLSIPVEKIFRQPATQHIYFDNNAFSPVANNNNLFVQGFLGEIEHFVGSVEKNTGDEFTSLKSLQNTYAILDQLKAR